MKFWKFLSNQNNSKITQTIYIDAEQAELKLLDKWIQKKVADRGEKSTLSLDTSSGKIHFIFSDSPNIDLYETLRKAGHTIGKLISTTENIACFGQNEKVLALCEGLVMSLYTFQKYLSKPETKSINISTSVPEAQLLELDNLLFSLFKARDFVNEPPNVLDAVFYAEELTELGAECGMNVEVLEEAKIESLKMGGLLAVNQGSDIPATFTILEWKPEKPLNDQPIVFVGKGVTYDTGGLSLKPTPNSMDFMKADMAGSASIAGAIAAIALNKLPVHVIALIPATDNRIGKTAFSPGDVITMYSGAKVEILNTDAEGRLVLADALHYAKKYKPSLVIDVATLTGAAARAIGKEGIVYMGTASDETKKSLETSGHKTYERLVEFPLWFEYEEQLKSSIADFTNLGGAEGGAITAGKFLQKFTDYPWLHLDIAGPSFLQTEDSYRGKNGTGVSVRLLYDFVKSLTQSKA